MGEIIVRKVKSMNWKAKISLVLVFTLVFSTFMYHGLYKPKQAQAIVPARVQSTTGNTGANQVTTFNLTAFGTAPVDGNTLVAVISTRGTTANRVSSVTSTGASWSFVAQATNANGTTTEIWYAPNVSGAGTTVTVNLAASLRAAAVAIEYSGVLSASAVDQTSSATGNSTNASTGTTAATTQADELWLGGVGLVSSGYTLGTITNSFTAVANASSTNATATNNARVYALERIVSATGTANTGGTISTSSQWSGAIATFKAAPGTLATYYADNLTATNVGADGITNMTALGDFTWTSGSSNENRVMMDNTAPAGTTRYRIGENSGTYTGQEFFRSYTPAYSQPTTISANATAYADWYMRTTGGTSVASKAVLYEYNDTTGIVGAAKGTASFAGDPNLGTRQTMNNVSFGNAQFTVAVGNRLMVSWQFDAAGARPYYLWGQAPSATPSGYQSITVIETPIVTTLTIGDGGAPLPANKTVYRNDQKKAVDKFTLSAASGDIAVSQLVITATSGAANIAPGCAYVYLDVNNNGEWDAGDTSVGGGSFSGNTATLTVNFTVTSGSTNNYLVVYDIAPTATSGNTINGYISSVTSNATTTAGSDNDDATLTVASQTLTVGDGTAGQPPSANVQQGSTHNAVAEFTLATSNGTNYVSQIVVTGTNAGGGTLATNVAANGVTLWLDNGSTANQWDAGDTQIGTDVSFSGTTATFSGLNQAVTTTAARYIVTYDIAVGATVGGQLGGSLTAITSDANSTTNNDNADATLTITAGTCTRVAPTVSMGSNGTVIAGSNKVYTITVTNNDAPAAFCGSSNFSLAINPAETGDTGSFNVPSSIGTTPISVTAGASNTSSLTVSAKVTATTGHILNTTVRATDAVNHGALPGSGSVSTTVVIDWANNALLHNSTNTGSSYWAGSSGWGEPSKKYGPFVCETCHAKSTTNIKRIKTTILTPDGSVWSSTGTTSATVSFLTTSGATSGFGNDGAHTTSQRICEVCHSQVAVHKYNQSAASHNGSGDCTVCHKHNKGFSGDGPCMQCHDTAQNVLYNTRQVVGAGGDFVRPSRHVSDGTTTEIVTSYDCVVCHAEGDAAKVAAGTGWIDKSKHGNGTTANGTPATDRMVKLRNVDNRTASYDFSTNVLNQAVATPAQKTAMRDNMDTFCMNCHDSNGANDIAVGNGATPSTMLLGTNAQTTTRTSTTGLSRGKTANLWPFNSADLLTGNTTDSTTIKNFKSVTYGRVLNVKDQFNSTNVTGSNWASHHNLNQYRKRYSTRNTTAFPNAIFVNVNLKEGNLQTLGETIGMHCSDCHLNEVNAHGAANSRFMLQDSSGNDTAWTGTAGGTNVCYKCHATATYVAGATTGRFDHDVDSNRTLATITSPMGIICFNCHGGYSSGAQGGLGAIHGTNETYTPAEDGGVTSKRYRFMSGSVMRFYKPVQDATTYTDPTDWSSATLQGSCYTVSANDTWTTGCSSHNGGTGAGQDITPNYRKLLDW